MIRDPEIEAASDATQPSSNSSADPAPRSTRHLISWKELRDGHPLFVLITAMVGAGAFVAIVLQYFNTEHTRSLEAAHAITVENSVRPLIRDNDALRAANSQLLTDLASIRRTVGPEAQLFDIRKLFITNDDVKTLSPSLTYFDTLQIYAKPPLDASWRFDSISEHDLVTSIQGDQIGRLVDATYGQIVPLHDKTILFWRSDGFTAKLRSNMEVLARAEGIAPPDTLNLFPFVAVSRLDRALLYKSIKLVAADFEEGLTAGLEGHSTRSLPARAVTPERAFAADLAGVMMVGQSVILMNSAAMFRDAVFSITNIEKKGPVLYMNARVEFTNATIVGRFGKHTIHWNREIIVAAIGDQCYVIMTSIPTIDDGRSAAYGAVQDLLTNIRIPSPDM